MRYESAVSNCNFAQKLRMEKINDGHQQKKLESFVTDYFPTSCCSYCTQNVNSIYDAFANLLVLNIGKYTRYKCVSGGLTNKHNLSVQSLLHLGMTVS